MFKILSAVTFLVGANAGNIEATLLLNGATIGFKSAYLFTLKPDTPFKDNLVVYFDFDASLGIVIPYPLVCNLNGHMRDVDCTKISDTRIQLTKQTAIPDSLTYSVWIDAMPNPSPSFSVTDKI
jgi:hypothetical protein